MSERLNAAIAAIDAANAKDPGAVDGRPEALLYGERMSAEQARLYPAASEPLQIACRGQHIERWLLPRADFPAGRDGYLAWRAEQGARHAARVAGIMSAAGYGGAEVARASRMLRKDGIKRDAEVQALEDVACFTFLRHYFLPFAAGRDPGEVLRIVRRTARKMSARARSAALETFDLPPEMAEAFASQMP
ncbi:MAG: DUF4202 domain-containing protein [Paracoccus sp. (in: a-proteobacteria)]|nr:DUF4202 domain-containing protein [Paracoccus sp. (in: a-proteobacteria)]